MKKNSAVWFVVGFICGLGSLLSAIAGLPGSWLRPEQAQASPIDQEIRQEMLGTFERLNRILDKADKEFTETSEESREAMLACDLQTVRSQIELYKVQHLDSCPGINATDGSFSAELFMKQLTCVTDSSGKVMPPGADKTDYTHGPYLLWLAANPFTEESVAAKVKGGSGPCPGDGETGWYFDISTGLFSPNDAKHKND